MMRMGRPVHDMPDFATAYQEEVTAAAEALGIQPSDTVSRQSAIEEIVRTFQDGTPLRDQLPHLKNVSLHCDIHVNHSVTTCKYLIHAILKHHINYRHDSNTSTARM